MIADIGVIGGIYTFVRLLLMVAPSGDTEVPPLPAWERGVLVVAMVVIALLTVDIFMIGSDWLSESVGQ